MSNNERSQRIAFLGLIAWVSVCLLLAGWAPMEVIHTRAMSLAGLFGLIAAVGLSESLRTSTNNNLARLQASSTTDPLTGVGNRRLLDCEIERRIAQLRRHGTIVSLLMIDVDHFKRLNDSYGHLAGDAMLRKLAKILVETLRDMDLITRYGGEEFVAVLPGTDLHYACLAAERIRFAVEQSTILHNGRDLRVTISIGVTEATVTDTHDSLVHRVDAAMYQAKNAGRNCCRFGQANAVGKFNGIACPTAGCTTEEALV